MYLMPPPQTDNLNSDTAAEDSNNPTNSSEDSLSNLLTHIISKKMERYRRKDY